MADQVQEISCFGEFGCVGKWHEYFFSVYADGTLTALMERASKRRWRVQVNNQDEDMRMKMKTMTRYEERGDYVVEFTIGTWRPKTSDGDAMVGYGRLSTSSLTGCYRNLTDEDFWVLYDGLEPYDEDDCKGEFRPFELFTKPNGAFRTKLLYSSCLVLVPGSYSFHGHAFTDAYELLGSSAFIELLPNGKVRGKVDESLRLEDLRTATIKGTWKGNGTRFTMTRK